MRARPSMAHSPAKPRRSTHTAPGQTTHFVSIRGCALSTTAGSNVGHNRLFGNADRRRPRDRTQVSATASGKHEEARMSTTIRHGRREFLKGSAAAMLAAGAWGWQAGAAAAEDHAAVHGMAIAGEQTVVLYHL